MCAALADVTSLSIKTESLSLSGFLLFVFVSVIMDMGTKRIQEPELEGAGQVVQMRCYVALRVCVRSKPTSD